MHELADNGVFRNEQTDAKDTLASDLIIRNVVRFIQSKFCFRFSVSHYML